MHMVMLIPFEGTFGDRSFTLKRAVYRATRRPKHSDLWWCASVLIRTYQNSGPHLQPLESYSEENQGNKVVDNEQSRNCGGDRRMKIPRPKTITPSPKALRFALNQETLLGNIAGFSVSYFCGRV